MSEIDLIVEDDLSVFDIMQRYRQDGSCEHIIRAALVAAASPTRYGEATEEAKSGVTDEMVDVACKRWFANSPGVYGDVWPDDFDADIQVEYRGDMRAILEAALGPVMAMTPKQSAERDIKEVFDAHEGDIIASLRTQLADMREALKPKLNAKAVKMLREDMEAEYAVGSADIATAVILLINWHENARATLASKPGKMEP